MVVLILPNEAYVFLHWGYEWWTVCSELVYTWDWWGWVE